MAIRETTKIRYNGGRAGNSHTTRCKKCKRVIDANAVEMCSECIERARINNRTDRVKGWLTN